MTDEQWAGMDRKAWEDAASKLQADGWTQHDSNRPHVPPTFSKDGETVILIRSLGALDWHPRETSPA